jgi:hypothetical protein
MLGGRSLGWRSITCAPPDPRDAAFGGASGAEGEAEVPIAQATGRDRAVAEARLRVGGYDQSELEGSSIWRAPRRSSCG